MHKIQIRLYKHSVFLKAQLGEKCQFYCTSFLGSSFAASRHPLLSRSLVPDSFLHSFFFFILSDLGVFFFLAFLPNFILFQLLARIQNEVKVSSVQLQLIVCVCVCIQDILSEEGELCYTYLNEILGITSILLSHL